MNKSVIIYISFLFAVFNSCTKSDTPTPIPGKVKTIKFTLDTSQPGYFVANYNYDGDGRLINVISTNANGQQIGKITYNYSSTKILIDGYDSSNNNTSHGEYFLNALGLVDSVLANYSPIYLDSTLLTTYTYNTSNEVIAAKSFTLYSNGQPNSYWGESNYSYSSGNLSQSISVNPSNSQTTIINYEYYNTISNLTPEAYGLPYRLLQSTNLVKKAVGSNPQQATYFSNIDYTYTFDGNGRVSSQTISNSQSNFPNPPFNTVTTAYYTYY